MQFDKTTQIITIIMLILAFVDLFSFFKKNHKDFKSIIISLGVFGTFLGVYISLQGFDTHDIKGGVPLILEGLKTAFATSVAGMAISIVLSIIESFFKKVELDDEVSILNSINNHIMLIEKIMIDKFTPFEENLKEIKSNTKHLESLHLMNTKLDSIDTNFKSVSKDISSVKEEMKNNQRILFDFLEDNLTKLNQTLEEALDFLSKGATEEIIRALENVIADFNKNLTDQFGDNFKQLNESVKNMILWQENYKNDIEVFEQKLNNSLSKYDEHLSDVSQEFNSMLEATKEFNNASQETMKLNLQNIEKSSDEIKNISSVLENMSNSYSEIATTSNALKDIIETNKNQIANLEVHLQSLTTIGEKASISVQVIDDFSSRIQESLNGQSEALKNLTSEISTQLPESLDELNRALTSLTNKFRNDYEQFLQTMANAMAKINSL